MSDFFLELGAVPQARKIIKTLGIPVPMPQRLMRARGPVVERELADKQVAFASGGNGKLLATALEVVARAGGDPWLVDDSVTEAAKRTGESFGRPGRSLDLDEPPKLDAIVFDASGVGEVVGLKALYDVFHALIKSLRPCGRVVVLGRSPSECASAEAAASQAALEGFVRSIAKEVGKKGSTAALLVVHEGATERLAGPLRFYLSPRSAFVSGQPFVVNTAAADAGAFEWQQSLEGKIALVTGAARGIGAATARRLAEEGAHVVCLDRPADDALLAQVAREVEGTPLPVDVSDPLAPESIVEHLEARHGGVDIVVHNAGVTRDKTIARMKPEYWEQALDINLAAVSRMTDALVAGPLNEGGRIICLSSVAGIAGNVGQTNYAASKAGIIGYCRALAPAVAERGITVNAIAPGFIETRLTAAIPVMIREAGRRLSNLGQGGLPVDVAEAITFLSTPSSSGMTGQVLRVCGGGFIGA